MKKSKHFILEMSKQVVSLTQQKPGSILFFFFFPVSNEIPRKLASFHKACFTGLQILTE